MILYNDTLNRIVENRDNKISGRYNSIPFGIMDSHLPGIMKGVYYIVTANSGVGKTQITKHLFVFNTLKFVADNPHAGISPKIFYFALEESRNEFMASLMSTYLNRKHGLNIPTTELLSLGSNTVSEDVIRKLQNDDAQRFFALFEKHVEVVDNVSHPTGIYEHVKKYLRENGTDHYKTIEVNGENRRILDKYEPNDPNQFTIVITDHIGLLQPESGEGNNKLYDSMSFFSRKYCQKMLAKHYNCAVINVQQQMAAQEGLEAVKLKKLEPSLNGLAENKTTGRDAHVVLGLFAPVRYNLTSHLRYDIEKLRDNYRSILVLKNRLGKPNLKTGLFFNGASNLFIQLPYAEKDGVKNPEMIPFYAKSKHLG